MATSPILYRVECQACGWEELATIPTRLQKLARAHLDDNPHRNYTDTPLF